MTDQEWQREDEVTTTFGSLQQGLAEANDMGRLAERERILDLLERFLLPVFPDSSHFTELHNQLVHHIIAAIKGWNK